MSEKGIEHFFACTYVHVHVRLRCWRVLHVDGSMKKPRNE